MTHYFRYVSRIVLLALPISFFFGFQVNAQEACPPWAQDRLNEIQQEIMEIVNNIGSPYSNNGSRIAQLYQDLAEIPPTCLRGGSLGGHQSPYSSDSPGSIYQYDDTIIAPGIAGCDGTGCVPF